MAALLYFFSSADGSVAVRSGWYNGLFGEVLRTRDGLFCSPRRTASALSLEAWVEAPVPPSVEQESWQLLGSFSSGLGHAPDRSE